MGETINRKRRDFLQYAAIGTLSAAFFPGLLFAESGRPGNRPSANFKPDVEIELTARPDSVSILLGKATRCWKFHGRLLKGPEGSVQNLPDSYLGPIFRLQKGQKVRILFKNELPEMCVTHWHGLHVPAEMDGHPMYAIETGQTLVYEFDIRNRAGTYWFHPHTHEATATQVYAGLAGLILVSDEEERALPLPAGEFDIPIVLQDRSFDATNQFRYITHRMQTMMGFLGNRIMVNGRPDFVLPVADRSYRLRFLNGSNSRIYKLAWDDATPITVIGTDGGLLESPETHPYVMLAPGERIEVFMDFSGRPQGSELTLRSLPFSGALSGMHGRMSGGMGRGMGGGMCGGMGGRRGPGGMRRGMGMMGMATALPLGSDYPVLKVKVARKAEGNDTLPARLSKIRRYSVTDAVNPETPRPIALSMQHMNWTINGRSYEMEHVMDIEKIPVNSLQLLQIYHSHSHMGGRGGMGMGMMGMAHPIHLHGQQFQVVSRSITAEHDEDYATVKEGYINSGWKDTVLVMPGETVKILKPFDDFKGRFMYHCHNLEHEDMGMMRDFLVI